jgi:hypothetical protein
LPVAYLIHLAEEWFGGFSEWTRITLGNEVSQGRFILINAIAFLVIAVGIVTAFRHKPFAWFSISIATLFVLNGILHLLATLMSGVYSPGTISGILAYIPLGIIVFHTMSKSLSKGLVTRSIIIGILLHGLVAVIAFVEG